MRAVIFILILAVIVVLIAIASGFVDISQTRPAKPPGVSVNGAGVTAKAGRAPAFDVETGTVSVATRQKQVAVPTVKVNPPGTPANQANAVTANAG